jgi:hypothetical protein
MTIYRHVRRILHKDLNFHPYKTTIVQELSDSDMARRRISSEQLLKCWMVMVLSALSWRMMNISTYQGMWTKEIIVTGHLKTHRSSIIILFTAKDWLSGVGSHLLEILALTSLKTDQPRGLVVRVPGYWSWGPGFDSRFYHGNFSLKGKLPMVTMVWVV